VIAMFARLVARNAELEKRLSELRRGGNKGEGISSAQLSLFRVLPARVRERVIAAA